MELDLEEVMQNVNKDFQNSTADIDFSYQSEGWYRTTLTVMRTVNLLLCAVLVVVFTTGGV